MSFDRFDICAAYYLYGMLYHNGQFSKEYKYLGRALKCGFNPGPLFSFRSLSDNGKAIFRQLRGNPLDLRSDAEFQAASQQVEVSP
jgi:hypothetical protein